MKAVMRKIIPGAMAGALLLAAGCGEDAPPTQTPAARVEMSGTATGGMGAGESVYEASAKGAVGRLRTSSSSAPSSQYAVSLTELTAPYALSALVRNTSDGVRVYGVTAAQGRANLTPLTSLLVAQLYGQDPATVFQGFGPGGSVDPTRITAANIADAQTKLTAFIHEELGITLPANLGNLVTAPFTPAAGDPMYDSIAAILSRLEALDITPQQFTTSVAQTSRLCLTEHVIITSAGNTLELCPQTKSATPIDGDADRLEYVYVDRHGNTLTVAMEGNSVLSASYQGETGSSYLCQGTACAGITLGAPAADLTRPMQFSNLMLSGTGTVSISGTLTGAIPGVVLPVLPCDNNRFFAVFPDRSVVASCVDPDQYGLGIGAYLGDFLGVAPSRVHYEYSVPDYTDPTKPKVTVVTDANDAVLAVEFFDFDPDTYTPRRTYGCRLAACNGITLGNVTVNTDILGSDPAILIRTVTFQGTLLTAYDADGNDTAGSVELTASLNTAYYDWVAGFQIMPIIYPPTGSCGPGYLPIAGNADGTTFDLCLTPTGAALVQTNGDVMLVAGNYETNNLRVLLRGGRIVQASVGISNQPLGFLCNSQSDCDGITVSAPAADGRRTLRFDNPILYEALLDRISGTRSLRLDGGTVTFEPQIPQP